ncbi:AzlC family protein [Neisseria meningitidis]|nr:AzlC family protein [Neisseria meningitidis]
MIKKRLFRPRPQNGIYSGLTKTSTALPRLSSKRTIL